MIEINKDDDRQALDIINKLQGKKYLRLKILKHRRSANYETGKSFIWSDYEDINWNYVLSNHHD